MKTKITSLFILIFLFCNQTLLFAYSDDDYDDSQPSYKGDYKNDSYPERRDNSANYRPQNNDDGGYRDDSQYSDDGGYGSNEMPSRDEYEKSSRSGGKSYNFQYNQDQDEHMSQNAKDFFSSRGGGPSFGSSSHPHNERAVPQRSQNYDNAYDINREKFPTQNLKHHPLGDIVYFFVKRQTHKCYNQYLNQPFNASDAIQMYLQENHGKNTYTDYYTIAISSMIFSLIHNQDKEQWIQKNTVMDYLKEKLLDILYTENMDYTCQDAVYHVTEILYRYQGLLNIKSRSTLYPLIMFNSFLRFTHESISLFNYVCGEDTVNSRRVCKYRDHNQEIIENLFNL